MIAPERTLDIAGVGAVGQTIAAALVTAGFNHDLLIASRTIEQATTLALDADDLRTATGSPTRPTAVSAAGLHGCEAVVEAVRADFTNSATTHDVRTGGILVNTAPIMAVAGALRGFGGVVLMVTNPVDMMTRLFAEVSGCGRVYGIGSSLDTARYRRLVTEDARVPVAAADGHVFGDRTRPVLPGTVLSALTKTLGLADGPENLSVPCPGDGYGPPLRFTAGSPRVAMPAMTDQETARLAAADDTLRAAYQHITQHLERI